MMLRELSNADYQYVWDKFDEKFKFCPSVEPRKWPSIDEPVPSITISLTESNNGKWLEEQDVIHFFKGMFNQLPSQSKIKYILDWCHRCYYAPDVFEENFWVYPADDYAICLSDDLNTGTFAHPWERTICVFGEQLLYLVQAQLPQSNFKVLRDNCL